MVLFQRYNPNRAYSSLKGLFTEVRGEKHQFIYLRNNSAHYNVGLVYVIVAISSFSFINMAVTILTTENRNTATCTTTINAVREIWTRKWSANCSNYLEKTVSLIIVLFFLTWSFVCPFLTDHVLFSDVIMSPAINLVSNVLWLLN